MTETTTVTKASGPDRFEIAVAEGAAGFAEFVDHDGRRVFFHTEIGEEFGGRGLAKVLVRRALDATRAEGLTIVPVCPFVKKYLAKHDDWADVVSAPTREDLAAVPA